MVTVLCAPVLGSTRRMAPVRSATRMAPLASTVTACGARILSACDKTVGGPLVGWKRTSFWFPVPADGSLVTTRLPVGSTATPVKTKPGADLGALADVDANQTVRIPTEGIVRVGHDGVAGRVQRNGKREVEPEVERDGPVFPVRRIDAHHNAPRLTGAICVGHHDLAVRRQGQPVGLQKQRG